MAGTIADELLIRIGVNLDELKAGLNQAINSVKNSARDLGAQANTFSKSAAAGQNAVSNSIANTAQNVQNATNKAKEGSRAFEQMTSKWGFAVKSMLRTVAAPIAGALTFGSVIKTYFSGVAQVAQMTGAYSQKLEEWRKKRALLARVNREDIELYKKGREALFKFQMSMANLSTTIMRAASPAIKWLLNGLSKLSDWIDRNEPNIVRFLKITSAIIATALIPNFLKLASAMMMNPITWILAALVGLIAVIDDLVVWLHGGNSALDSFWSQFGSREEVLEKIQNAIKWLTTTFKDMLNTFVDSIKDIIKWFSEFWTSSNGTSRVISTLKNAFKALGTVIEDIKVIWAELVAMFSDNGFLDDLKDAFDGTLTIVLSIFNGFFIALKGIFGLIKGILTGDWGSFNKACDEAVENAKKAFSGLWKAVKAVFNQIWEFTKDIFGKIANRIADALTPDFLKSSEKNREALKDYDPMSASGYSSQTALEAGTAASNVTNSKSVSSSSQRTTVNNIEINTNSEKVGRAVVDAAQESSSRDFGSDQSIYSDN